MKEISFEKALADLEKVVTELEEGDLSLDASLKRYEDGVKLVRLCREKLDKAKKKIETLIKNEDGTFEAKPFEEE
jgi:exodeoxyribonuclease VII small subunit